MSSIPLNSSSSVIATFAYAMADRYPVRHFALYVFAFLLGINQSR